MPKSQKAKFKEVEENKHDLAEGKERAVEMDIVDDGGKDAYENSGKNMLEAIDIIK